MGRLRLLSLLGIFCLAIPLFVATLATANNTLSINEAKVRLTFADGKLHVELPIGHSLPRAVSVNITIELVDPQDRVRARVERTESLNRGLNSLRLPLTFLTPNDDSLTNEHLVWYRLRYRVNPNTSPQLIPVHGVLALREIAPEIFHLRVAAGRYAAQGETYRLLARTEHPLTGNAVREVEITAKIRFEAVELSKKLVTDGNGEAWFDFTVPRQLEIAEGDLTLTAVKHGLVRKVESEIDLNRRALAIVTTDKPLYQPGQNLHVRALFFDPSRQAIPNAEAHITIKNPTGETVFRSTLTTSRFGVASVDWEIPESTRLGDYDISISLDDSQYDNSDYDTRVKITRYDLPNFSVDVKPDRGYYTMGQNAQVVINADYLFGEPVKRGHVRVVRELARHWDYREQKWKTEEGETYEGDLDAKGHFSANINLTSAHKKLSEQDYSRFEDLTFAAYVTDPTTNRTEERRFDLRITKQPIHIYVIDQNWQTHGFPLQFYLTASYADGSPAQCDIAISERPDPASDSEYVLTTVRTNRLGLAKITEVKQSAEALRNKVETINFRARDAQGNIGTHSENFYFRPRPVIRVNTDKIFYRPGEPIRVHVTSSEKAMRVMVEAVHHSRIVISKLVQLVDGNGWVTLPYQADFKNDVIVGAYSATDIDDDYYSLPHGRRTVIYPQNRDLNLQIALNREIYKPGEEANIDFITRSAEGKPSESALGVVIFDKAVEQRALTDGSFGGSFGFYRAYAELQGDSVGPGGISRSDLERIDLNKPLPEGIELAAEILLNNIYYEPRMLGSDSAPRDASQVFSELIGVQLAPLTLALQNAYGKQSVYPTDEATVRRLLLTSDVNMDQLLDPWEQRYRAEFAVEGDSNVLLIKSAGTDKLAGTPDDFTASRLSWPYFRFTGEAINRAVVSYNASTGAYIRDEGTLKRELLKQGLDLDKVRDPWNQPYRFEFQINATNYTLVVFSGGPDGTFLPSGDRDQIQVWKSDIDYSLPIKHQVDTALGKYFSDTNVFPQNEAELTSALKHSQISRDEMRDAWGNRFYATFAVESYYQDKVRIITRAKLGEAPQEKTELTPVTSTLKSFKLRSNGPDGRAGTYDDFDIGKFWRITSEEDRSQKKTKPIVTVPMQGATGAITGVVTDVMGAVVANATISAKNNSTAAEYQVTADENGLYLIKNLPTGVYQVSFDAQGFRRTVISEVLVRSSTVIEVNAMLSPGAVTETVTVTASSGETTTNATTAVVENKVISLGRSNAVQTSTPRLREYFPETLVWQPSLETDARGRAQLKFKLADNITTWKMSVLGSTPDGQIGTVEKEIRSFQPFFVDLDPPRILTEGDQISLPVVVRNYLERPESVQVEIKPEEWFSLSGPTRKRIDVPAGDAANTAFDIRAVSSIEDGKQRVTATASAESDAIEKPVTVHPDGEELTATASDIVLGRSLLKFSLPDESIPGSTKAELKIYPNLLAHAMESVEAIMSRPYGCGEQTISSTYPSLLLLLHQKRTGVDFPERRRAERYLNAGYVRLLSYNHTSGGFSYWNKGEPDLALTAYALRFLNDAKQVIEVDEQVINRARIWLMQKQVADGSWNPGSSSSGSNKHQVTMLTAYVARVLAMRPRSTANAPTTKPEPVTIALQRALSYLNARAKEIDEPYVLAAFTLAAVDSGNVDQAHWARTKLLTLARREGDGTYWSLETNTPFYGWGLPGRVETTALVLQALSRQMPGGAAKTTLIPPPTNSPAKNIDESSLPTDQTTQQLLRSGLLFLLKQKDRYGVWYSTQATINVLDAILEQVGRNESQSINESSAAIVVNGTSVKTVSLPPANQLAGPILVDVSKFVQKGKNVVEIQRKFDESMTASAQVVANYYVRWTRISEEKEPSLRLSAAFDRTAAKVGDRITCNVKAERVGFRGYGMLLAEIGLPPGADVDRASLDEAVTNSNWSINQYDVLPDRVVFYLWPRAGGISFNFKFRPRFELKAKTAATTVYDYYNPEAKTTVMPTEFVVSN